VARTAHLAPLLGALSLAGPPLGAGSGIEWSAVYQDALRAAREQGRVVFAAVNMDDERSSDALVKEAYRDKRVLACAERTVNLIASEGEHSSGACSRFGTISCAEHRQVANELRAAALAPGSDGHVVAPQHVFLGPDGKVLASVPYAVSAEELLWCFALAARLAGLETGAEPHEDARPPRRLIVKEVCNSGVFDGLVRPLSDGELEQVITDLRSGWGALEGMDRFNRVLATDHTDAIKFATAELGAGITAWSPEITSNMVRAVARFSPPSFWAALEPCLEHHGPPVKCEAAAALEQLAAPKSLSLIKRALADEDDVDVRKNLIRALGAAGASSSTVAKSLMREAEEAEDRTLRLNAILALGHHADRPEVAAYLLEELDGKDAGRRQAAALAMAFSRLDALYLEGVRGAQKGEKDPEVASLLARVATVLEGDNLRILSGDFRRVGEDQVPRVRYFYE